MPIPGTLRATPQKRQRMREEITSGWSAFEVYEDADGLWCMDINGIIICEVTLPELLRHAAAILEEC